MGARQRSKGHTYERKVIRDIKHVFPNAVSARQESRSADARGLDIVNTGPLAIQCKSTSNVPPFYRILELMDTTQEETPVVFWQKTEKAGESGRFMVRGEFCILKAEDFIKLIEYAKQAALSESTP